MREENFSIDLISRILDLLEGGTDMAVIRAAVGRSSDTYALGALIGLIEDMETIKESGQISQ